MKDKIEVSKIDIKIGDKTISLKPEQAKELKKILNEMFEESHDQNIHHYWWNYPWYSAPALTIPTMWSITCGSSASSSSGAVGYSNITNATSTDVTLCLNQ